MNHALNFLAENNDWQLVGHQHNVWETDTAEIKYYKRVAGNSWRAILRLVPHKQSWLCIHRYEGSWSDPNAPYYGGLQMDLGFQKSYGLYFLQHKGTANYWTPIEQMVVAETAFYAGRGFYPWPNTARYCGLI